MKKRLGLVLRTLFILGCLVYAFWGIDFGELWKAMSTYSVPKVLGGMAFSFVGYVAMALRLNYLSNFRAGNSACFWAFMMSFAVNNILPAKLGELAKAFYLRKSCGFPLSQSLSMVFWERFFDLNAILLMAMGVAFAYDVWIFLPLLLGVAGIWAVLIFCHLYTDLAARLLEYIPTDKLSGFAIEVKRELLKGISPVFLALLGLYTCLCWALYLASSLVILIWVAGLPLTLGQAVAVFVISGLGMALPSSPGSLGVFEAACVFSMGLFGIDKEAALAAGIILHMVQYIPTTSVGFFVMARDGVSLASLRQSRPMEQS